MSFSPLLRAVGVARRSRRGTGFSVVPGKRNRENRAAPVPEIDFSPVHGRHCICDRCLRAKHN